MPVDSLHCTFQCPYILTNSLKAQSIAQICPMEVLNGNILSILPCMPVDYIHCDFQCPCLCTATNVKFQTLFSAE